MDDVEQRDTKLARFLSVKPKPVDLPGEGMVKLASLRPGERLPLVVRPAVEDVDLVGWARQNSVRLDQLLLHHGGILFRGFEVGSVSQFEQFALTVCAELFGDYGDLPPEEAGGKVYRSTPYPSDKTILFHNESSHLHRWPMKQFFFSIKVAQQGGETPIVDGRKMYEALDPGIIANLKDKKLLYVRNFTDGLDVSWREFFRTEDKAEVESYCRRRSIRFEWKENGLRMEQLCPAVVRHPRTGEAAFFNQVQLHHVSCLEPAVRESLLALFGEEDLPRNVYYGDGSPIEDSVMEEISRTYWLTAVSFAWQEGDILMLDNMLTAHARNPYSGDRKIVVAMGDMFDSSQLQE